jgi:group I intron endonuclease
MIIYKTTNLINGKLYIGKDKYNNPEYLGSGKLLVKAIKKYGKENFKKEILEYCENDDHMAEREKYWISIHNACVSENYYNIGEGGFGGDNITNNPNRTEICEKIKAARKLQVINHSEDTRKKIGNSQRGDKGFWYGKSQSIESNQKRSDSLKGKPKPPRTKEHSENLSKANKNQVPWNKGKQGISDETRKKMSDAKKGKAPWNKGKSLTILNDKTK